MTLKLQHCTRDWDAQLMLHDNVSTEEVTVATGVIISCNSST